MRTTRGWGGARAAVFALGISALVAAGARASTMDTAADTTTTTDPAPEISNVVQYHTVGSIDTGSVTGTTAIGFNSLSTGEITTTSVLSLGDFVLTALPAGVSTTYNDTQFSISFITDSVNGQQPANGEGLITVTGTLNGTVSGPSKSTVVATFDPPSTTQFQTGNFLNLLSLPTGPVWLAPSTTKDGLTSAQATLAVQAVPIPEPATVALFLTAIAGYGLRRRLRAGR